MSSKHFTFECQSQIKRHVKIFDDSSVSDQDVSEMSTHQIQFDDGIYFLLSLITTILNHGSQLDAHQLVNIFLPFSKNPDLDLGRICAIQPFKQHLPIILNLLKFIFALSRRANKFMKDINNDTNHMDICQGKAFHDVITNYNTQSAKGQNEIFKLIFDKKHGAIGGIYDDFKKFDMLYPNEAKMFECGIEQTCKS